MGIPNGNEHLMFILKLVILHPLLSHIYFYEWIILNVGLISFGINRKSPVGKTQIIFWAEYCALESLIVNIRIKGLTMIS